MKFWRRYWKVIVWAGVIFFLSSFQTTPSPQDTILNFLLKKTAHVVEYAILYWLTFEAVNFDGPDFWTETTEASKRHMGFNYLGPFIFVLLYAIFDEIHQSFVPNRHARWYDVAIFDFLGIMLIIWKIKLKTRHSLRIP